MKSNSTFLSTAAGVLAIMLLSGMSAFACSCMAPPTVDIVYQQTRNIAIFTVESVSEPSKSREGWSESAKLKVERVFKGSLKPDDIETEPVTVDGKGTDDLLELSYPFAACSKE